ncbi:MAG: PEGA domain-containing protein [Vicinamibacterales bacterium]
MILGRACSNLTTTAGQFVKQRSAVLRQRYGALLGHHVNSRIVPMHPCVKPFLTGVLVGVLLVAFARDEPDRTVAAEVSAAHAPAGADRTRPAPEERPDVRSVGQLAATEELIPKPDLEDAPTSAAAHEPPAPRQRAFRGSLHIQSVPSGARVLMNSRYVGTTPLLLQNLPVGSRAVRLSLAGHDVWSRAVQVVANRRTAVVAPLNESATRR